MAIIALCTGALGVVGAAIAIWPKNDKAVQNVELVLDRSEAMNQPFDTGTKFDAAKASVANILTTVSSGDNLALREFGGECGGEAAPLTLKFRTGNVKKVQQTLSDLKTSGRSTLVRAVVEATGDFNALERFRGTGIRIVVVTGGYDECQKDAAASADPAAVIKTRLKSYDDVKRHIVLDLHFIGVALKPEDQEKLGELAQATGATFINAPDRAHLDQALHRVLVTEPAVHNVNAVMEILNNNVALINTTIGDFNNKNYEAAERDLSQALRDFNDAEEPFKDLGRRQEDRAFRALHQKAAESREYQRRMLEAARTLTSRAGSNDAEGRTKATAAFNSNSDAYNTNTGKINELVNQLVNQSGPGAH